jgi:S1-C subfamily serine protease
MLSSRLRVLPYSFGVALLFLTGFLEPVFSKDEDLLAFKMLVSSESKVAGIGVFDGDPVLAGTKFRVEVSAKTDLELDVLVKVNGEQSEILRGYQVKSGTTEVLPSNTEWLLLPDEEGAQTVLLRARAENGDSEIYTRSVIASALKFGNGRLMSQAMDLSPIDDSNSTTKTQLISQFSRFSFTFLNDALSYAADLRREMPVDIPLSFRGSGVQVYAEASSSVVKVLTNEGSGTGSIVTPDGEILTNWHVIEEYGSVGIRFKPDNTIGMSGEHVFIANVVRVDQVADLALLKLNDAVQGLPVISLLETGMPDVGSNVHAIGHPEDQDWTYTRGYISQIRKEYKWPADDLTFHEATVIQTQTPLNPGNSGGPLLNDDGVLVGVNSFIRMDTEGINYAVSLSDIRRFLTAQDDRWIEQPVLPENYEIDADAIWRLADQDGNGIIDTTVLDTNENDVPDLVAYDEDEDGIMDYFELDANENGTADAVIRPVMEDGQLIFVWALDEDEDGEYDALCVDTDGDWEVDNCRKS